MSYTARFTEYTKVLDRIVPGAHNGMVSTEWCAVNTYHRAFALISCGPMAGTLDVAVWQATNAAGAGAKYVAASAITQLTAADTNAMVGIELQTEDLDVDGGFDFIRVQTVNGPADNVYEVVLLGLIPRYGPVGSATDYDEIVNV